MFAFVIYKSLRIEAISCLANLEFLKDILK